MAMTTTTIIISTSVKPGARESMVVREARMGLPLLTPGLATDVDSGALVDPDQLAGGTAHDLDLVRIVVTDSGDDRGRLHDADVGRDRRSRDHLLGAVWQRHGDRVVGFEVSVVVQVEDRVAESAAVECIQLHEPAVSTVRARIRARNQRR